MNRIVLLVAVLACLFAGCSFQAGARGELYYPKENQGNVWKSRAEFHRKPKPARESSWTDSNMPKHWR